MAFSPESNTDVGQSGGQWPPAERSGPTVHEGKPPTEPEDQQHQQVHGSGRLSEAGIDAQVGLRLAYTSGDRKTPWNRFRYLIGECIEVQPVGQPVKQKIGDEK
jgi:hypothetical protein